MELALSLGDSSKPFPSLHKSRKMSSGNIDLGFCMGLAAFSTSSSNNNEDEEDEERPASSDPPPLQQLDVLPASSVVVSAPVPVRRHQANKQLQWLSSCSMSVSPTNSCCEGVVKSCQGMSSSRVLKRKPLAVVEEAEDDQSSPNSTSSSFQHLDFSIYRKCFGSGGNNNSKRPWEYLKDTTRIGDGDTEEANNIGGGGGGSDDEDNRLTRKKLRLSKDQSAFLEESFKEHNTLTPKQKIALAKELNLRPRQVEVWFQNRRARTKLKQTEVNCEYLKRCCETLTEENRRLQKELQELRALKTSQPFFMQLPATTLTMCPSCERVTSATPTATASATTTSNKQPQHPSPTANTTGTNTANSTVGGTALALAPPPNNNSSSNTNNNSSSSSSSSKLFPFLAAHAQAAGQRTTGSIFYEQP